MFFFFVAGWREVLLATIWIAVGSVLAYSSLLVLGGLYFVLIMVLALVWLSMGDLLSSAKS